MAVSKIRSRKKVYYIIGGLLSLIIISVIIANCLGGKKTDNEQDGVSAILKSQSSGALQGGYDKTIILDPGHGGPDPGATGIDGIEEKDLNLKIALLLRNKFEKAGYSVIMTREEDITICDSGLTTLASKKDSDLNNRIKIISNHPRTIFISIHQNSNENSKYSGAQVYYSLNNKDSKTLAQTIQNTIESELQPDNTRKIQQPQKLRLLLQSQIPAVIVECGFISNAAEAHNLEDAAYEESLTSVITESVEKFFASVLS